MFYVIYNPDTGLYRDEFCNWGQFDKAERFNQPSPVIIANAQRFSEPNARWVGPCRVGEEP